MIHEEITPQNSDFSDEIIGQIFGAYRITKEIGRGGMGVVYLAERADGFFEQEVAIKFVKRGMDTDSILKRFRNERQILAALSHPNVALLYDGGTANGLPYFVMEFVAGEPLYRFCDSRKLTVKERLKIFIQICEAVHAVHQIKVVHRDLKPSNILVTANGTPKLLDFGIAKLLDHELADTTVNPTATQMRLMTPEYASPEQVVGGEITTASDIYSLGVLLYELLSGHRPYRLKNRAPFEIARIICEESPESLSRSLSSQETFVEKSEVQTLEKVLETRGSNLLQLRQELSGDIEQIVMNALHKKPENRYQSALELAEDLKLYLKNEPIKKKFVASVKEQKSESKPEKNTLAVLPLKLFGTPTGSGEEEYLSLGLTDAFITRLSNVGRLTVRPTTSVLPFQDGTINPFSAGQTLQVEYVVDGNIRRVGNRVRVSLQLLNISKGSTIWAEKFDEKFTDVLELEDVISDRVVKVLLPKLTGEEQRRLEKRGTNNVEAYQAYLRGRYFANQFSGESLLKSIECYREAIQLDPNYALPHVGIADFYVWSAVFGEMPCREAYPKAKDEIERALIIDDSLGEAFAIKAFITLLYDWDWAECEKLVKRALELNPNFGFAHECYSNFFSTQGIVDEAVREIKRAEELDPLSPRAKLMTAWTFCISRRFPEGIAKANEANNMQDNFAQGLLHLGYSQISNGQVTEAVKNLRRATEAWTGNAMPKFMLCFALVADNKPAEAREVLAEIKSLGENGHLKPYFLGMAYAAVGEKDLAFEWFEKSLEARDEWMIWFGVDAKLDDLRKDSRYLKILQKTNNPISAKKTKADEKSIAVLPFKVNLLETQGNTEERFLGLGLTDALITRLSKAKQLIVRPTSSVLRFEEITDAYAAGKTLDVKFVLDGNLRVIGNRVRLSVQLLDIEHNSTNWAENFDEKFTDILELEDSISEKVATSLLPKLTPTEQKKLSHRETNNAEAYQAYLRGRYFWNQFTPQTFPKALESFEKAVELDPNYALAYAGIADYYNWATIFGFHTPLEGYEKTRAAALRALELDDSLAEAFAVLGFITAFSDYDWAEGERLFKQALELNPNFGLAHEWYSAMLAGVGRFDEAYVQIVRSLELDPLSIRTVTLTAWTLYQLRHYEEALVKVEEIHEMNPNYYQEFFQRGNILNEIGRAEEAVEAGRKGIAIAPELGYMNYKLCFALASTNRFDEARELLQKFEATSPAPEINSYHFGMCHVALGEYETAFKWFNKAIADRHPWIVWLSTEPKLDHLRGDERFKELLRKTNRAHLSKGKK